MSSKAKIPTVLDKHRERLRRIADTASVERERIAASHKVYTDDYRSEMVESLNANTAARLASVAADAAGSVAFAYGKLAEKRSEIAANDEASWNFARLQVQRDEIAARLKADAGGGAFGGPDRYQRYAEALDGALASGDRHTMRATAGVVESMLPDLDPVSAGPVAAKVQQVSEAIVPAELAQVDANLAQLRDDAKTFMAEAYALETQFDSTGYRGGRLGASMWGSSPSPVAKALGDVPPPIAMPGAPPFAPSPLQQLIGVRS